MATKVEDKDTFEMTAAEMFGYIVAGLQADGLAAAMPAGGDAGDDIVMALQDQHGTKIFISLALAGDAVQTLATTDVVGA